MVRIVVALALATVAAPSLAAAPADTAASEREAHFSRVYGNYDAIRQLGRACAAVTLVDPAMHQWTPSHILRALADFLRVDPAECPGTREAALAEIKRRLGDPADGNVNLALLHLAWQAAERGQGMVRDSALADRYGRMLWLYTSAPPPLPSWPDADRERWLATSEAGALIEARVAAIDRGTVESYRDDANSRIVVERLAALRIRRDVPGYDPGRAAGWFERLADAAMVGTLLSDGVHLEPDYPRAARLLLRSVTEPPDRAAPERRLLLQIGRAAEANAKTPIERAEAARILFAAMVHDPAAWDEERAALLRGVGSVLRVEPHQRDADCAANFVDMDEIAPLLKPFETDRPEPGATIALRGLIGPDNRLVWMEVNRSSGSAAYDAALLRSWARVARRIGMWNTARDRFVLVDFPPSPVARTRVLSDACLGGEFAT